MLIIRIYQSFLESVLLGLLCAHWDVPRSRLLVERSRTRGAFDVSLRLLQCVLSLLVLFLLLGIHGFARLSLEDFSELQALGFPLWHLLVSLWLLLLYLLSSIHPLLQQLLLICLHYPLFLRIELLPLALKYFFAHLLMSP